MSGLATWPDDKTYHPKDNWISVDTMSFEDIINSPECLAYNGGEYLVGKLKIHGNSVNCEYEDTVLLKNVTHYMPLPSPPVQTTLK